MNLRNKEIKKVRGHKRRKEKDTKVAPWKDGRRRREETKKKNIKRRGNIKKKQERGKKNSKKTVDSKWRTNN